MQASRIGVLSANAPRSHVAVSLGCVRTALSPHPEELAQQASPDDASRRLEKDEAGIRFGASWFETALIRLLTMRVYYAAPGLDGAYQWHPANSSYAIG